MFRALTPVRAQIRAQVRGTASGGSRGKGGGSLLPLAAATLVCLTASPAATAPRIDGPAASECRDTLSVANAAFYSKAFRLDDAVTLPKGPVRVVAQRIDGDLSGGDAVNADTAIFDSRPQPADGDVRKLYWQISPVAGVRWAISVRTGGWRGDFYSLYALDPSVAEAGFTPADDKPDPRRILTETWMPPLILSDNRNGAIWAVDTRYENWVVYATGPDGVAERCRIVFGPRVKATFDLLPAPLRALAVDLDGTMGDGRDEGTLQPTATLRDEAGHAWENAVLRPWAVTTKPYNTRRDVDAGLRHWSHGSADFRTLYRRIQAEYPAAVDALADLYVRRFGKAPEAAHALAVRNLDVVYRSSFVFPQAFIHPAPAAPAAPAAPHAG